MKHVGQELFRIIESKGLQKKEIAEAVGISSVYMYQLKNKNTMDCELLEKISFEIGISPAYFFDDYQEDGDENGGISTVKKFTESDVKLLKQLLAEKERIIKILLEERESGNRGKIGANE